ncbi:MAG TPA: transglycosylase domain-containing protein, partial [Thermoanaerobaculia bacterium]|nr:transglycosylase domain-containing protein [Thermoanaerobaculia bacterium]
MQRTSWESFRRRLTELDPRERRVLLGVLSAAGAVFLVPLAFAAVFLAAAPRFPRAPFQQPSRLYGRPARLAVGSSGSAQDLIAELLAAGYREAPAEPAGRELPPGTFRQAGDAVALHLRRHPTPTGPAREATVEAVFAHRDGGDRIASLRVGGKAAQAVELEPPLLASYFGPELNERRPCTLDQLPDRVPHAVLAAEDDGFYTHPGVSPSGILRAAWANFRGGQIHQGGSTLTQQLVKNLYLTQKRTLSRKAREAAIALLIEMRFGKRAILEAYLNEIYWGKSGSANLIGLGAAANAYFGKEASELNLAEAATLAGMIRAPGEYSPVAHPEKAIERRNHVLQRLADLGWEKREDALAAERQPLALALHRVLARRSAPYFADAAAAEARQRFGIEDLENKGYLLFSTLGRREQAQAEEAVAQGLAGLEKGPERRHGGDEPLQAALLSADPRDGAILAYVGGRDHSASQFDRISQAHRQAGSAFKPVIYAAAFADSVALPTSLVNDSPILVRMGDQTW